MIFTNDLIGTILESRESLIVISNGVEYTITESSNIPSNIDSIKESYEFQDLLERVQIKRKYGQYEAHKVNKGAPIRNKIVEFVGSKFITDDEMQNFLLRLEEEKGSSINKNKWFGRNQKYFESFQNRGQKVWTLSKFGKRILEYIVKAEKVEKKLNENMTQRIGLFKFVNESIDSIEESIDVKYWADYNDDTSGTAPKSYSEKSRDFKYTFDESIYDWNDEADETLNKSQIEHIKKMAMEFFKEERWISVNVIHAMIMQES